MTQLKRIAIVLGCVAALGGCTFKPQGNATMVRRDLKGGTLALKGDETMARNDASAKMSSHCSGPYTVVTEEMAVVGETTVAEEETRNKRKKNSLFTSGSKTQSASETRQITELHITYQCGDANAVATSGGEAPAEAAADAAKPDEASAPAAE